MRLDRNWSQEELSERSQVGIKHISSLENGHREPCLGIMVKLAGAFGVKISALVENLD